MEKHTSLFQSLRNTLKLKSILTLGFLVLPSNAACKTITIKHYSFDVPFMLDTKLKKGHFYDLFKAFKTHCDININLETYPVRRSFAEFMKDKNSSFGPS